MNRIKFVLVAVIISASIAFCQPSSRFTRAPLDSIEISGYKVTRTALITADGDTATEELTIMKGDKKIMLSSGRNIGLFNFGTTEPDSTGRLYAKDINGDGVPEVIITAFTESGFCCNYVSIIGLGNDINEIGRFELKEIGIFYLEDIDGDLLPELFFRDPGFINWHMTLEDSPKPLLIWKWRDNKYYLANDDFSDYLTAQIKTDDLKELDSQVEKWRKQLEKSGFADKDSLVFPPPRLLEVMLDYCYADKEQTADSLLNASWPADVPGKDDFRNDLMLQLNKSPYWKIIKENSAGNSEN